jgi:hypothetical protein
MGVYLSQLIRHSRACGSYQDFLDRGLLLTRKLLKQGFFLEKLKSSLRKSYGRHHDLIEKNHLLSQGFVLNRPSLYLWYPLFQAQWGICDQRNHQTWNYLVKEHHLYSGT